MNIEGIDTLLHVLKRKQRFKLLMYVAVCNAALVGIFISAQYSQFVAKLFHFTFILIAATSLVLVILWFFKRDLSDHPVIRLIKEHKEDVVWVYWHRTENMPFGVRVFTFNRIYIRLADSSFLNMTVQRGEVDELLAFFKLHFKRAVFGYSVDREQLYNIDPELVSKY